MVCFFEAAWRSWEMEFVIWVNLAITWHKHRDETQQVFLAIHSFTTEHMTKKLCTSSCDSLKHIVWYQILYTCLEIVWTGHRKLEAHEWCRKAFHLIVKRLQGHKSQQEQNWLCALTGRDGKLSPLSSTWTLDNCGCLYANVCRNG